MFFQNKYFLFLIVKIMILLIIGFKIDIFTTVNKYIYNITVPYFFYETKHNKDISLVDISHISQEELLKILDIVNIHNPKLIVADIFHSDNLVKENFLQNILNKNILFISVDKISIFDSLFTQENSKYLKFYDIQKLYGKNVYTSKDFSDSRNLENYFSIKNDFENNQYFINHNGNYPFIKIDKKDILLIEKINRPQMSMRLSTKGVFGYLGISMDDSISFLTDKNNTVLIKTVESKYLISLKNYNQLKQNLKHE